ncbi:MAG: FAD:protein FMN transferase, partial [Gemmatimonadetes bacterium]|nr:FAD:protein FMN transferase [Gemmatimonadota bacterium]
MSTALLGILLLTGPVAQDTILRPFTFREVHMGVAVRITLWAPNDSGARAAATAGFREIARLEEILSDWRPSSELRRLESGGTEWQPTSPELAELLATALLVARASDGAFDPTIGPLTRLWRAARHAGTPPDAHTVAAARQRVGFNHLEVDTQRHLVRLRRAGMQLDLGGIAKGYILQRALAVLREHGAPQSLVEGGGDLVVGDAPPGKAGWSIATPLADATMGALAGTLTNAALATSGPTEQQMLVDGHRESHIVDPSTGHGTRAPHVATVIGSDAALADAVATALTVLTPEEGRRVLARFGLRGSLHDTSRVSPTRL